MNLSTAKKLVFHQHHNAVVVHAAAKSILIPVATAFVTDGDGEFALIHQFKTKRVACSKIETKGCFDWVLKPDLLKGKVDQGDASVMAALKRETFEEGQLDWSRYKIDYRFLGWIIVPSKKPAYGEYRGLTHKIWLTYLLKVPSQDCLKPYSHGVSKIEWRRDPENAFKDGSDKQKAVLQIMNHLRHKKLV